MQPTKVILLFSLLVATGLTTPIEKRADADAATQYAVDKRSLAVVDADAETGYQVDKRADADAATQYAVDKRADADAATQYAVDKRRRGNTLP